MKRGLLAVVSLALACASAALACDAAPVTTATVANGFPTGQPAPYVVYRARWQAVTFDASIAPGAASPAETTVAASANTAYVLVAPGWDPSSAAPPTAFLLLQSRQGFSVALGGALRIPVDDATFEGDCAAGSPLSQATADFLAEEVFRAELHGAHYDAATCRVLAPGDDAGADDGPGA